MMISVISVMNINEWHGRDVFIDMNTILGESWDEFYFATCTFFSCILKVPKRFIFRDAPVLVLLDLALHTPFISFKLTFFSE